MKTKTRDKKNRVMRKQKRGHIKSRKRLQAKAESKKNDVICIIGMHRSGTSMVTRFLNLNGLELGPLDWVYVEKWAVNLEAQGTPG